MDTEVNYNHTKGKLKILEGVELKEPNWPKDVALWCQGSTGGVGNLSAMQWIDVPTPQGIIKAEYRDIIVKDSNGDFRVFAPKSAKDIPA